MNNPHVICEPYVGYSWEFNLKLLQRSEEPPIPNVYVTNSRFAHIYNKKFYQFYELWDKTDYNYWENIRPFRKNGSFPGYFIFQNVKELQGRRVGGWMGHSFRTYGTMLSKMYKKWGFLELDEYLFTTGRYEFEIPTSDGWHYGGTKKQMAVVALFNMICNEWLQSQSHI
jgi:hypothetical protein